MGSQLWCNMPERINELTNRTVRSASVRRGHIYSPLFGPTDRRTPADQYYAQGFLVWRFTYLRVPSTPTPQVLTFDLYGRGYSDSAFPNDVHLFTGTNGKHHVFHT